MILKLLKKAQILQNNDFLLSNSQNFFCLVCFVALHPKSIAMVMGGRSVHLTTLFLGKLEQAVNQYFVHILWLFSDVTHDVFMSMVFLVS